MFRRLFRIFLTECGICQRILCREAGDSPEQGFRPFKIFPEVIAQTQLEVAQMIFRCRLEQFKIFILNHIRRGRHGHVQIRHSAGLQQFMPDRRFGIGGCEVEMRREILSAAGGFQRTPAGPAGNDLFRRLKGKRLSGLRQKRIQLFPGQGGLQFGGDFLTGGGPVGTVHDRRIGLKSAVCLHPFPCGTGRHGQTFHLRVGETRLNFHIRSAIGGREALLPVHAAGRSAPDKKFAALETVRGGLTKSPAVAVDRSFKLALFRVKTEKEVLRKGKVFRVSAVIALRQDRHFDLRQNVPQVVEIGVGEDFLRQRDNAQIIAFIHRNVGPPVHGHNFPVVVVDPGADKQKTGVVRQEKFQLITDPVLPAQFIKTQDRRAVKRFRPRHEHGSTGPCVMTDGADVPLHPARTPGIADRQISRLDHGVVRDQITPRVLVHQTEQFSSQIREKSRLEVIVFQHRRLPDPGLQIGIVFVLQFGWHGTGAGAESDVEPRIIRKFIFQRTSAIGFHGRHGGFTGKIRTQENLIFKTQFGHGYTPFVE